MYVVLNVLFVNEEVKLTFRKQTRSMEFQVLRFVTKV